MWWAANIWRIGEFLIRKKYQAQWAPLFIQHPDFFVWGLTYAQIC